MRLQDWAISQCPVICCHLMHLVYITKVMCLM